MKGNRQEFNRIISVFLLLFVFLCTFCFSDVSNAKADIPAGVKDQYEYNQQDSSIVKVKKRLQELGYYSKSTTFSDIVSESMKDVVIMFQQQNGMKTDGIIGREFLERLFSKQAVKKDGKSSTKVVVNQRTTTSVTNNKKGTSSSANNKSETPSEGVSLGMIVFLCIIVLVVLIKCIGPWLPYSYNIQNELHRIDNMDGVSFERWCCKLLNQLGYQNIKMTNTTGDFGADIVCKYNGEKTVIQCKRYGKTLGLKPVQEVLGARAHYGARRMMVMTNNYFSSGAQRLAQDSGVILWDRKMLMNQMRQANRSSRKEQKIIKEERADERINSESVDVSYLRARIKNEYSITVKRRYDNSTYVLYREADSENDAMRIVNSVIKDNDVIVDVQQIRTGVM